jgi:transcriptional regulator with XRE-family HTH domain
MSLEKIKQKLFEDKGFKKYYENPTIAMQIGRQLLKARIIRGITQTQLAKLVGTKQSGIARLENGTGNPSLSFLIRIAKALDTDLIAPTFGIVNERDSSSISKINFEPNFIGRVDYFSVQSSSFNSLSSHTKNTNVLEVFKNLKFSI